MKIYTSEEIIAVFKKLYQVIFIMYTYMGNQEIGNQITNQT